MPANTPNRSVRPLRKFGLEVECFNISEDVRRECRRLGWTVKGDCSIRGERSAEIVSPPLSATPENFRAVKNVLKVIREGGGRINSSCGIHVHVDARNDVQVCNPGKFFLSLLTRYVLIESQVDLLVPASRRSNNNNFCRSPSGALAVLQRNTVDWIFRYTDSSTLSRVRDFRNSLLVDYIQGNVHVDDMRSILRHIDRYHKVNVQAFTVHGTVEFRHFGASLNGTKVTSWIKFCLNLMEVSRAMTLKTLRFRKNFTEQELRDPFFRMRDEAAVAYLKARIEENRAHPTAIRNPRRHREQLRAARTATVVQPVGVTPVAVDVTEELRRGVAEQIQIQEGMHPDVMLARSHRVNQALADFDVTGFDDDPFEDVEEATW